MTTVFLRDDWNDVGQVEGGISNTPEECPEPLFVILKEKCLVLNAENPVCEACQVGVCRERSSE